MSAEIPFDLVAESGGDPDVALAMLCSCGYSEEDARLVIEALGIGRHGQSGGAPRSMMSGGEAEDHQVQISRDHSFDGFATNWPPMDALAEAEPDAARDFGARAAGASACVLLLVYRLNSVFTRAPPTSRPFLPVHWLCAACIRAPRLADAPPRSQSQSSSS
jgi:hypothetical protein